MRRCQMNLTNISLLKTFNDVVNSCNAPTVHEYVVATNPHITTHELTVPSTSNCDEYLRTSRRMRVFDWDRFSGFMATQ